MKNNCIDKSKPTRWLAGAFVLCGAVLTISPLFGQTPSPTPQWPSIADRPKVKAGFTRTLTRSAKDQDFRNRLLDFTNQESVKQAVQEELNKVPGAENMVIPPEVVIIFYVPQERAVTAEREMSEAAKAFLAKGENRNYHVFYLPDYNPSDATEHKYDIHLKCCYRPW